MDWDAVNSFLLMVSCFILFLSQVRVFKAIDRLRDAERELYALIYQYEQKLKLLSSDDDSLAEESDGYVKGVGVDE